MDGVTMTRYRKKTRKGEKARKPRVAAVRKVLWDCARRMIDERQLASLLRAAEIAGEELRAEDAASASASATGASQEQQQQQQQQQQEQQQQPSRRLKLTPEQRRVMGVANVLYGAGQFQEAAELLMGLVRAAPRVADPYHTLGLIQEELGAPRKALEFYMIAAHLTPRETALWKRLASMATAIGEDRKADYCLVKAARALPTDPDPLWQRAALCVRTGRHDDAADCLRRLVALCREHAARTAALVRATGPISDATGSISAATSAPSASASASASVAATAEESSDLRDGERLGDAALKTARTGGGSGGSAEDDGPAARAARARAQLARWRAVMKDAVLLLARELHGAGNMREAIDVLEQYRDDEANSRVDDAIDDSTIVQHAQQQQQQQQQKTLNDDGNEGDEDDDDDDETDMLSERQLQRQQQQQQKQQEEAVAAVATPEERQMAHMVDRLTVANMLVELRLDVGDFEGALALIGATRRELPAGVALPLEFVVNTGICQTYLGALDDAQTAFNTLFEGHSVDECGDLYYSVAETYAAVGEFQHALSVFDMLALSQNPAWDRPAIWLKRGHCFRSLGRFADAAACFHRVLDAVPTNLECVVALCEVYQTTGEKEKALGVLDAFLSAHASITASSSSDSAATGTAADGRLHAQELVKAQVAKANILYELERYADFLAIGIDLWARAQHGQLVPEKPIRRRRPRGSAPAKKDTSSSAAAGATAAGATATNESVFDFERRPAKRRRAAGAGADDGTEPITAVPPPPAAPGEQQEPVTLDALGQPRAGTGTQGEEEGEEGEGAPRLPVLLPLMQIIGESAFFEFVLRLGKALSLFERYGEGVEVLESALDCARMSTLAQTDRAVLLLKQLCVGLFFNMGQYQRAFDMLRPVCMHQPDSAALWTLYNRLLIRSGLCYESRPQKFLVRLLARHPRNFALTMLVAHHCLLSSNTGFAIAEYSRALAINPDDPMVNLCLGLALLFRATNRRIVDRHRMVLQAFAFLHKYARLRGVHTNEALYNLARAHQHLGINHIAEHLYTQLLARPDPTFRMEAAFNLAALYRSSGLDTMARYIIQTYCQV